MCLHFCGFPIEIAPSVDLSMYMLRLAGPHYRKTCMHLSAEFLELRQHTFVGDRTVWNGAAAHNGTQLLWPVYFFHRFYGLLGNCRILLRRVHF